MNEALPLDPALESRLLAMPKVELHVHLEGAQLPETIWHMARKNGVALPAVSLEDWKSFYQFRDFAHFIEVYIACSACMQTPEDFAWMTEEFHRYQAEQNIIYTEAFLSASLFVNKLPRRDLLDAFREGLRQGRAKHGVEVRFIPDIARNFPESQRAVLDFTLAGFDEGLFIGLGLGGLEQGYPPELFTATFAEARQAGLHVVAHAGEGAGAASVRGAVESLHAERIGHGIRCLEDPGLVHLLRERRIPIEVCPLSNFRTGVVGENAEHPIFEMIRQGLFVTVNSDDPPMFATSLTGEYRYLARNGLTWSQIWELNRNGIRAAFLNEQKKAMLCDKFDRYARDG
jgi:adenosine deaminase